MMKRLTLILAFAGMPALGDTLVFDQTGFTAVHVNEDVTVNIEIGPEYSVIATSPSGDLSRLRVNRYDGWLVFSRDTRWFIFPNGREDKFNVTITMPVLNEIKSFDGSIVTITGGTIGMLRGEAADHGQLTLDDMTVADLTLVANNGGALTATGSCERLTVAGDADGIIDATQLACDAVVIVKDSGVIAALPETATLVDAHIELGIN